MKTVKPFALLKDAVYVIWVASGLWLYFDIINNLGLLLNLISYTLCKEGIVKAKMVKQNK